MKRLIILFTLLCIVMPIAAQDAPFSTTNTPPGNEAVSEPVVTVEPAVEPETSQLVAMVEKITNTLLIVIGVLTVLAGTLGIALFNSVPARVVFTGAVNLARLTPDTKDDTKLEKLITDAGGEIDKTGDVWVVKPKSTTQKAA